MVFFDIHIGDIEKPVMISNILFNSGVAAGNFFMSKA
jgi:hypothetical protein